MKQLEDKKAGIRSLSKWLGLVVVFCVMASCTKQNACFSDDLYNEHKDDFCTADCPGVIGCDGKSYCNTCEANRNRIRVE